MEMALTRYGFNDVPDNVSSSYIKVPVELRDFEHNIRLLDKNNVLTKIAVAIHIEIVAVNKLYKPKYKTLSFWAKDNFGYEPSSISNFRKTVNCFFEKKVDEANNKVVGFEIKHNEYIGFDFYQLLEMARLFNEFEVAENVKRTLENELIEALKQGKIEKGMTIKRIRSKVNEIIANATGQSPKAPKKSKEVEKLSKNVKLLNEFISLIKDLDKKKGKKIIENYIDNPTTLEDIINELRPKENVVNSDSAIVVATVTTQTTSTPIDSECEIG